MAVFEGKKSSNDILNTGIMSDDGVVASDVPPRYLFMSINKPVLNRTYVVEFGHETRIKTTAEGSQAEVSSSKESSMIS